MRNKEVFISIYMLSFVFFSASANAALLALKCHPERVHPTISSAANGNPPEDCGQYAESNSSSSICKPFVLQFDTDSNVAEYLMGRSTEDLGVNKTMGEYKFSRNSDPVRRSITVDRRDLSFRAVTILGIQGIPGGSGFSQFGQCYITEEASKPRI